MKRARSVGAQVGGSWVVGLFDLAAVLPLMLIQRGNRYPLNYVRVSKVVYALERRINRSWLHLVSPYFNAGQRLQPSHSADPAHSKC